MPTPSGAISVADIRAEIGYGAPYDLNSLPFRRMARKASGAISMSDLRLRYAPNVGYLAYPSGLGHDNMFIANNSSITHLSINVIAQTYNNNYVITDSSSASEFISSWLLDANTSYTDNYKISWVWDSVGAGLTVTPAQSDVIISSNVVITAYRNCESGRSAVCRLHIEDIFDSSRYVNATVTLTFLNNSGEEKC